MNKKLEKSLKQWLAIFISIISYYIVHEGTHLLFALFYNVFERIRIVGIWGVQIVTTAGALNGIKLALFSGVSSIVTILIGYILAFNLNIFKIKNKNILIILYYITLCFLVLDPLYISILAGYFGGGDLNGVTTGLSISSLPFRILFGLILIINIMLFKNKVAPNYSKIFKQ